MFPYDLCSSNLANLVYASIMIYCCWLGFYCVLKLVKIVLKNKETRINPKSVLRGWSLPVFMERWSSTEVGMPGIGLDSLLRGRWGMTLKVSSTPVGSQRNRQPRAFPEDGKGGGWDQSLLWEKTQWIMNALSVNSVCTFLSVYNLRMNYGEISLFLLFLCILFSWSFNKTWNCKTFVSSVSSFKQTWWCTSYHLLNDIYIYLLFSFIINLFLMFSNLNLNRIVLVCKLWCGSTTHLTFILKIMSKFICKKKRYNLRQK